MDTVNPYQSPVSTDDHHPVRIRLYGLFPTTRATYLRIQTFGFTLLAALFVGWFVVRSLPVARSILFFPYVPYIIVGTAVADLVEVVVVLCKFKQREREEAALD